MADDSPKEERVLFHREDLASTIDLVLEGDEHAPLFLGQLFVGFRQAIDSGLHGINETRKALVTAIELIYLHSSAHESALNLYRLSLEGQLKVEDEPVTLINAAIARSTAGEGRGKTLRRAKKGIHE